MGDRGSMPQFSAPQFPCLWNTGKGCGTRCPAPTSCVVLRVCLAALSLVLICRGSAAGLAQAGTCALSGPQLASPPPEPPTPLELGPLGGPGTFPSGISQLSTPIRQTLAPHPRWGREESDTGSEVMEVPRGARTGSARTVRHPSIRGDSGRCPPTWASRIPHHQQHPPREDPSWPDTPTTPCPRGAFR